RAHGLIRPRFVPRAFQTLKQVPAFVTFWHRTSGALKSGAMQPPADHGCLNGSARLMIAPGAIDVAAGEWQLIRAAVVLAQHLNRLIRGRVSFPIEFSQPFFTRRHFPPLPISFAPGAPFGAGPGALEQALCANEVSVWYLQCLKPRLATI